MESVPFLLGPFSHIVSPAQSSPDQLVPSLLDFEKKIETRKTEPHEQAGKGGRHTVHCRLVTVLSWIKIFSWIYMGYDANTTRSIHMYIHTELDSVRVYHGIR